MTHHNTENRCNSRGPYEVMLIPIPDASIPSRICAWRTTDSALYNSHPDCVFVSIESSKENSTTYTPGWELKDSRAIAHALHSNWSDIIDFILEYETGKPQEETSEHIVSMLLRNTADEFLHNFRQRRFNSFYNLAKIGDIVLAKGLHSDNYFKTILVFQKISPQHYTPLESSLGQEVLLCDTPQQNGEGTYLLSPRSAAFLTEAGYSAHQIAHLLLLQSQIENARKNGADLTTLQDIFKNVTNSSA